MASPSEDLQKAIYDFLTTDADLVATFGGRVYDGVPEDAVEPFVSFGPSTYTDDSAEQISGLEERLQLDIWFADSARLRLCKAASWLVWSKLRDAELSFETHALADLNVYLGTVSPDPDGITAHGIVQVVAAIEEA